MLATRNHCWRTALTRSPKPVAVRRTLELKTAEMKDWNREEVATRDKRLAAVHEASHVFVGEALGLRIVGAELRAAPDGGKYTKYWTGSVKSHQLFKPEQLEELPPQVATWERFKRRMYSLAGFIGEEMYGPSSDGEGLCVYDVMERLNSEWENLSETDRAAFPNELDSVCGREVEALLRLLMEGRDVVLGIADRLESEERLGQAELDGLPGFVVHVPSGAELADFDSWEILKSTD